MPDIRYIGKFGSADGSVYQVRIRDDEYDGAATDIPLESVRFLRGRRGIHPFTPIRASSIELVGYKLSLEDLDELLGADVGRFTAEVWRGESHAVLDGGGGERYWKGIVQTDLGEDDTANVISSISITATDGLSLLREVPYLDTTGEEPEPYDGRITHLETIRECLTKIGYPLPISVSSDWYPDEGEDGDILWEHAEVDQSIFYDASGRPASCYEVLKQILYPYGGLMFWRDGRIMVIQKSQIGAGTYVTNDYDEAGDADGTSEWGSTVDISNTNRITGQRTYRTAFSSATIVYHHGNIPSLIEAGDFEGGPYLDPEDIWTFGASGGEIRSSGGTKLVPPRGGVGLGNIGRIQTIKVGFVPAFFYGSDTTFNAFRSAIKASNRYISQVGAEVRAGDIIAFSARFRIPYNQGGGTGLYNTFFELQIGSDPDAYMSRSGDWYTPSGSDDLQPLRLPGSQWDSQGFSLSRDPGEGWNDVLIISAPSPATGDVRLVLYGTADINGSDLDPEGVEWADVAVLIVDDDGELRDSISFAGTTSTPEPADNDLVLLMGQGPHPGVPGRITWDGEDALNWSIGGTPENLYQLLIRTRLGYQSRRLEMRYETYHGLLYEMGDPVLIDGNLYDCVYQEKDLASQEDTIELIRIRFDDSGIAFTEVSEDRGTYVPGGGTSGTSVIANQGVSNVIEEKGDLIVGDADGNPIRLDSGEVDGKVIMTSEAAAGGWALANPTPITAKGDLVVGNATGVAVRLPRPPDGKVWVADSAEPLGWRAEDFSGGGGPGDFERFFLPDITLDLVMLQAAIMAFDLDLDIVPVTEAEIALGTVIT